MIFFVKLIETLIVLFVVVGSLMYGRNVIIKKKEANENDFAETIAMAMVIMLMAGGVVLSFSALGFKSLVVSNINDRALIQTQEDKIEILQEGIDKIQEELVVIISEYSNHEVDTFKDIVPESVDLLALKYPELKTNELAVKRMEILEENRKEINEARLEIVDAEKRLIANQPFYKNKKSK